MDPRSDMDRLRHLTGIKWSRYDDDVLPAWVADMDFLTAAPIRDAIRELVDAGDTGYNMHAASKIPRAFAEWSRDHHGWRPDVRRLRLFSGVLQPIAAVLSLRTKPGDGVVLFTPVYPPFYRMIEGTGRRVIDCPLTPEGGRIDPDTLASVVDERTTALILCQPHNPNGRIFDAEELAAVARVAEERDLTVISDEIWCDFVYPGEQHLRFATISEDAAARTVTATAASKSFSLGGLNCAVAHFGDEALLEELDAMSPMLLGHVNSLGAAATLAAWTQGAQWLAATLETLRANRDRLAARLAAELPDVRFEVPQATYLAWLDFRAFELVQDPAAYLLEHARVALSSGPDFGVAGDGFARLNFATYPDVLDEIIDRIVGALG